MKPRLIATAIGGAALLLGLAACSSLAPVIQNPEYSVRSIRPNVNVAIPLSASSIDFNIDLAVQNPNSIGLNLDRIDFDLLVNDSHVATGIANQGIRIPANGTGDVPLRTRVAYSDVQSIFRQLSTWVQGGNARYELRGNAYYNTPVGQLAFPFTVSRIGG
ncbi:MAG: LEA type 2 family protein [Thermoanaerobaculia bacterium]